MFIICTKKTEWGKTKTQKGERGAVSLSWCVGEVGPPHLVPFPTPSYKAEGLDAPGFAALY